MKKIPAVILTLAMMLCLGGASLPESGTSGELIGEVPVNAIALTDGDEDVYSVTVEWDDLSYEYEFTSLGTWNPETHKYDGDASGTWEEEERTITIKNGSKDQITATLSVAFDEDAGVEYTISGDDENTNLENIDTMIYIDGYGTSGGQAGDGSEGWFYVTLTSVEPSSLNYFEWVDDPSVSAPKVFGVITITLASRNL